MEIGDPIVLLDTTGFEDTDLKVGDKGWVNSIAHIPGDTAYVFFMPVDSKQTYVTQIEKVEVDEEAKAAGLVLNESTIAKG